MRGPGGLPFHFGRDSFCKWLSTSDLVMNLEMESRGWQGAPPVGLRAVPVGARQCPPWRHPCSSKLQKVTQIPAAQIGANDGLSSLPY